MYNYPYQPYLQQQNNGIIWIQGEAAAKSYLVAPGSTVPLWDSERQTILLGCSCPLSEDVSLRPDVLAVPRLVL